ncbi:UDP-glycosyltransferase 90A1-like [Chenopodium quinoa]|uniref:Glycosyltransferase n=1 Tax=Chenopodium quinoa TaxID=63459 RepID=A0A803N0B2_CHEQI|nr:UDP-glycosyltransferase 90A1-like [Chenopodium quinoa]
MTTPQHLHIALFPFMSKGHTIPLLHLTKFIHNHRPKATFTIFTTPANEPFISASLSPLPPNTVTIISFPFSSTNDDIPMGVESTDRLPSMSLFHSFAFATETIQPHFESALENIQKQDNPISFLISDGFLYWTQPSAAKFNIRRLVFYGMNVYSFSLYRSVFVHKLFSKLKSKDELIQVPDFPWIKVQQDDFDSSFKQDFDPQDPKFDFFVKCGNATSLSHGMVVNTFQELEKPFVEFMNSISDGPKSWCVGPFCLAEKQTTLERPEKPEWNKWLDKKWDEGKSVMYVAFGSQAEISNEQLKEILTGVEKSEACFLWALRIKPSQEEVMKGFEEKMKGRGLVVRGWVEQREVLEHKSVKGFLSHCGWNSAIESICAGVPILALPMMAEQHLNAKMVAEEIKVGVRVETIDGSPRGFVKWDGLSKMVKELMEGEMGKKVRKTVKELSEVARKSVEGGGSSWCNMETLLSVLEMEQVKI